VEAPFHPQAVPLSQRPFAWLSPLRELPQLLSPLWKCYIIFLSLRWSPPGPCLLSPTLTSTLALLTNSGIMASPQPPHACTDGSIDWVVSCLSLSLGLQVKATCQGDWWGLVGVCVLPSGVFDLFPLSPFSRFPVSVGVLACAMHKTPNSRSSSSARRFLLPERYRTGIPGGSRGGCPRRLGPSLPFFHGLAL